MSSSSASSSDSSSSYCCRGYCIDLLRLLSDQSNFTFDLYLSFDEYGALERNNNSGKEVSVININFENSNINLEVLFFAM